MNQLARYEVARRALAEAVAFDEVQSIMNIAQQAELYARQANDTDLIAKATEIRVRAQRRAGEMLRSAAEQGHRATPGDHGRGIQASVDGSDTRFTLGQIGITRDDSSRYQKLAAMPVEDFEAAVAIAKVTAGEVTTAFMLRQARKAVEPPARANPAAPTPIPNAAASSSGCPRGANECGPALVEPADDEAQVDEDALHAAEHDQLVADNARMSTILASDDRLAATLVEIAALVAEVRRLTERERILEELLRGADAGKAEAVAHATRHQNRANRLQRQLKAVGGQE